MKVSICFILSMMFCVFLYGESLQSVYDAATPGAGYDKVLELDPDVNYHGGFAIPAYESEILYEQHFDGNVFPPDGWVQHSLAGTTQWHRETQPCASPPYCLAHYHEAVYCDDWMVLPRMTLTDQAYIVFQEMTGYIAPNEFPHTIWVSAGSADPADGDYECVASFYTDVNTWTWRGATLYPYADQEVSIAFRHEGANQSYWFIDDIYVSYYPPPMQVKIVGNGAVIDLSGDMLELASNSVLDIDRAILIDGSTAVQLLYSAESLITNSVFYNCSRAVFHASIGNVTCYNSIVMGNYIGFLKSVPENDYHLSYNCVWQNGDDNNSHYIQQDPC